MKKVYDASLIEGDIYKKWEESGYFSPDNQPNVDEKKDPYTIVLPPPNVTGTLHMGHAVMLAIEDALIRYARLSGRKTLWIPGTDHAAIATESKVEKLLIEDGMEAPKETLGREEFLKRVDAFAQDSHDTIVNQMKKMGASIDWSREAFTLDEQRNLAVRTVFKEMYNDGLIYRGNRLINWSVGAQSVLADDELEWEDKKEPFYYIRCGEFIIGTVRPETKCANSPVVVNPDGEYVRLSFTNKDGEADSIIVTKFLFENADGFAQVTQDMNAQSEFVLKNTMKGKDLEGQSFTYETYAGARDFFVLADEVIDVEKGTGAMTISVNHSADDYDLANRRDLKDYFIEKIDFKGHMTSIAGPLEGASIIDARKQSAKIMKEKGLITGADTNYTHRVPLCYRSHTVVEPMISKQWFIDVNKKFALKGSGIKKYKEGDEVSLKELMQTVVRDNQVEILPNRFEKTYFHWIDNLRDWCISRQIWYGHQIPVWYKGDEIYVDVDAPEGEGWEQDPDTLDTWFSSGLWTFSTLGWPEKTVDLETFHPTQVLETGYDILFFWVARMILMTTYTLGEIPFETVYLHGLVRDEKGRKMSKSLGNIINPLDMIQEYGADATRLSLLIGATPGNDTKLSEEKIASYRNFTNKLWNISRFVLTSVDKVEFVKEMPEIKTAADAWILSKLAEVTEKTEQYFESYDLSLLGETLREFTWNEFADWYIEIAKIQKEEGLSEATDEILLYVLANLLKLWHAFMPFVTEEIYKAFGDGMIMVSTWPNVNVSGVDEQIVSFEQLKQVIIAIRQIRASYRIAPKDLVDIVIAGGDDVYTAEEKIKKLARVNTITFSEEKPADAVSVIIGDIQIYVILAGLIDVEKEKNRLESEVKEAESHLANVEKKLANKAFVNQAPQEVVEVQKNRKTELKKRMKTLKQELEGFSS